MVDSGFGVLGRGTPSPSAGITSGDAVSSFSVVRHRTAASEVFSCLLDTHDCFSRQHLTLFLLLFGPKIGALIPPPPRYATYSGGLYSFTNPLGTPLPMGVLTPPSPR